MESSEELQISRWMTSADISLLQVRKCELEEDKIVAEKWFSLLKGLPALQVYFEGESVHTLTLSRKEFGNRVLRDFLGVDPERKIGSYMEEMFLSISMVDAFAVTVVRYLAEMEMRGEYHQKEYAAPYGQMVHTATKQSVEHVSGFVKHLFWKEVTVEEYGFYSKEKVRQ